MRFPTSRGELLLSSSTVPSIAEWKEIWQRWDEMTSSDFLFDFNDKPIELRHPFIFYLGHIPCFCDMLTAHALGEPYTEPKHYVSIFERGIDPIVEDPTQCHPHSEIPEIWPRVEEVLEYKSKVRDRICQLYKDMESGVVSIPKQRLERVLHLAFEHEIMHIETMFYMLTQAQTIKHITPPPLFFTNGSTPLQSAPWLPVQGGSVTIGMNDYESGDLIGDNGGQNFGWDNESPQRQTSVKSFQVQKRPVSIYEYLRFLKLLPEMDPKLVPMSFQHSDSDNETFALKTLYGQFPVSSCFNLPVMLSYHQATAYKNFLQEETNDQSIKIPTEEELTLFYQRFHTKGINQNVGFQNFGPVPMCNEKVHVFGSVWEWTSTVFEEHEGFEGSIIYPGYSTDFFDGLHNVVLGGSWATHNRQVGRLRNFYQRSYPYAFIGVRLSRAL